MNSRSANQTKTEPFPAGPGGSEAETPASDHPQSPEGGTGTRGGDVGDAASVPTTSDDAAPGTSEQTPVAQGVHTPDVDEPDPRSTAS